MKRTFLILCLITIYTASYADIASVGYVNSVVDSLSMVATSGSYNDLTNKPTIPILPTKISSFTNDSGYITASYHDSTKQDKLPTGPTDGKKYSLIWDGKTGQFMFKEMPREPLQCDAGTYDIGFDQCINPATNGTAYGYRNDSTGARGARSSNTDTYGLTMDQTWGVTFNGYGNIKGIASCNGTSGTYAQSTTDNFSQTDKGRYCWCKMTEPAASRWVFYNAYGNADLCAAYCADDCASDVRSSSDFRSGVLSSVGQ